MRSSFKPKKKSGAAIYLLLILLFANSQIRAASVAPEILFQSKNLTAKGLFSRGIEGPAVDKIGNLYVPNLGKDGSIALIVPGKAPVKWLDLPKSGISNAIRFNARSEVLVSDRKNHQILKIDPGTKKISILVEDARMNQPNDFTVTSEGELFLSDPSWSSKKKGSIWRLDKNHELKLAATDLKAPNGIDLSPDEKKLYFTESVGGGLWSYDLEKGELVNKKLVHQFKPDTVDGIRVDTEGSIYVARITQGQIDRVSPDGKILNSIQTLGKEPTNLAFGGPDGKTVYITLRDTGAIETFRVPVAGREWKLQK